MQHAYRLSCLNCLAAAALCLSGCTSFSDYVHNGFKVGPEYAGSKATVAPQWIDANDVRIRSTAADLSHWWSVMNDPVLNDLTTHAYDQNINLKEYATRILQARASLAIAKGELFPQTQNATGSYLREAVPAGKTIGGVGIPGGGTSTATYLDAYSTGFNLAWELDFWGLYRRGVISAAENLDQSVDNYDAVLVTLMGDVSQYYVTMRTTQERIELARENVKLQRDILKIVQARYEAGTVTELDVAQQQSTLSQTEAQIPVFEIQCRQAQDQLCTLLGIPPTDLQARLGSRPIPTVPTDVAIGIPAQLLERRPDIRSAERAAASQAEQIGIAEAALYPHISITGTLGYSAQNASQLFTPAAFSSNVGPSFTWNILNYGRLANNVRLQDAKFQQTLLDYRTSVLTANQQAEDGLISFVKSQEQAKLLTESVVAAAKAFEIGLSQYRVGTVDFNRLATLETNLVQQQDLLAQARGQIAQGLIAVYRALGGGWEIRLDQQVAGGQSQPATVPVAPAAPAIPAVPQNPPIPEPNVDIKPLPPKPVPQPAPLPPAQK